MRSCPMYSSSVRGRSPARTGASSSAAAPPTRRGGVSSGPVIATAPAARGGRSVFEAHVGGRVLDQPRRRPCRPRPMDSPGSPAPRARRRASRRTRRSRRRTRRRRPSAADRCSSRRCARRSSCRRRGSRVRRATSPRSIGADEIGRLDARTAPPAPASGPMPLTRDQPLEQIVLERGREPEQRERILAHVRVDAQRDRVAGLAAACRTSTAAPARRSRRRRRRRSRGSDASRGSGRADTRSSDAVRAV